MVTGAQALDRSYDVRPTACLLSTAPCLRAAMPVGRSSCVFGGSPTATNQDDDLLGQACVSGLISGASRSSSPSAGNSSPTTTALRRLRSSFYEPKPGG